MQNRRLRHLEGKWILFSTPTAASVTSTQPSRSLCKSASTHFSFPMTHVYLADERKSSRTPVDLGEKRQRPRWPPAEQSARSNSRVAVPFSAGRRAAGNLQLRGVAR